MKKRLTMCLLGCLLSSITAWAYNFEVNGVYYNITDVNAKTVEVTFVEQGEGNSDFYYGSVTIPNRVSKNNVIYDVVRIGDYAFEYCANLTSINIPNSVTSIGCLAFIFCTGLTSIAIPNSVTSIGDNAFCECTSLTSITIPNSVTSINYGVFGGCSSLTSITIPTSVMSIGGGAFQNCTALTSVTIPNSVTSIGHSAFAGCIGLTSITIPNSVTSIGDCTFFGCSGLTSITIPNSVTSIGDSAFLGCHDLTSVTIPNSVTSIGNSAFAYCYNLLSITIPNSVTNIGLGITKSCYKLASIVVSEGNNVYDSRDNCNAIINSNTNELIAGCKNTIIPNDVTSIGTSAFSGCYIGETSFTIPNSVTSIGDEAFWNCNFLRYLTIPNSVTSIGHDAFAYCYGLNSVTLNSATSLGDNAFFYCSYLTSVTSESTTPVAITENVFSHRANATLYVPVGSKAAYQAADYWKDFKEIVEIIKRSDVTTQSNALYVEPINACKGGNSYIQVKLKNSGAVTSYGLDLVLPSGMSITTDTNSSFDSEVTLSNRHASNHAATTNKISDSIYRIGVTLLNSRTLSDNDGVVLTIKAQVAEWMAEGVYPIIVRNPLIVNSNGTKPDVFEMHSQVTVANYQKGDVDGDGFIDLADAVLVINHYVGKPVTNFIENAADVDGDHVIDLADAVLIINYYVGKIPSLSRGLEDLENEPQ